MRSKKFYLSIVAVILLLSVVGVVLAQENAGPPESADLTKVKEDAVRAILDNDGSVIDPNKTMAKAARTNEGGFGGWYFSDDKNTVYVYMTDTTKTEAAETAFNTAYTSQHSPANIVTVPGNHSLDDLSTWLNQMIKALLDAEILLRSTQIDQGQNLIKIDLDESASLEDAQSIRNKLNIPPTAVQFALTSNGDFLAGDDLQDKWRPLVGGIQHQQIRNGLRCTISFGTERDDEEGIVLASHCTNEARRLWGLDNAVIHQPVNPFGPLTNTVAEETIDPLGRSSGSILCTDYDYICRNSDAA